MLFYQIFLQQSKFLDKRRQFQYFLIPIARIRQKEVDNLSKRSARP